MTSFSAGALATADTTEPLSDLDKRGAYYGVPRLSPEARQRGAGGRRGGGGGAGPGAHTPVRSWRQVRGDNKNYFYLHNIKRKDCVAGEEKKM